MKNIDNYNFKGKNALIRVDFNVPLNSSNEITDYTRIEAAVSTIKKVISQGGRAILMSHMGRPDGEKNEKYSLKHIVKGLSSKLGIEVKFSDNCIGESAEKAVQNLKDGDVLLLENLRFHKEETKGDLEFSEKLSKLGDVYINDAFGTAHRAHASTTIVAQFFPTEKMFGYVIEKELLAANKVMESNERPLTAIMGGAKVSDKILLIEKLLDKIDNLIIGGGMAYTFFKAMGGQIGNSLVETDKLDLAQKVLNLAKAKKVDVYLPKDSKVSKAFTNSAETDFSNNMEIREGFMGLDIGPQAIKDFTEVINRSKVILWNGPMGVFEMSNFEDGTKSIAQAVADATKKGAYSLIGGGDSAAAVNQFGFNNQVSYISTGGGALLEYMEGKVLPGIKAIQE